MGLTKEQQIAISGVIDEIMALGNVWGIPHIDIVGTLEYVKADIIRQDMQDGVHKLIERGE